MGGCCTLLLHGTRAFQFGHATGMIEHRMDELRRVELAAIYYRATRTPARRWLPIPLGALFDQATVVRKPGLILVYGLDAPKFGNLLMSHSEVGVGTDEFGNQYQDGDMAYRDAFTRATPSGRMGVHVPDG
jgi:hypothetical protein